MHELGFKKKRGYPAYICFKAGDNEYQKLEWIKKVWAKPFDEEYMSIQVYHVYASYTISWHEDPVGRGILLSERYAIFAPNGLDFNIWDVELYPNLSRVQIQRLRQFQLCHFTNPSGAILNGKDVTSSVSTWWWIYFENTVMTVSVTSALFALRGNNSRIGQHASLKTLNVRGPINAVHHS